MNKNEEIQFCEVLDLAKIKNKCPQVIKECECCGGIIIDDENVPEEYIVNYSDRQIHSAVYKCIKCANEVCENCIVTIEGDWEKLYICSDCYDKYKNRIDHVLKLQKRVNGLMEEISEEIEDFLND